MAEATLVERLRHPIYVGPTGATDGWILDVKTVRPDMSAAAAEIEQLRIQLENERAAHFTCVEMRNEAEAERDRLRKAIKPLATIQLWRDTYPDAKCDMFADSMLSRCDGITVEDVRRARDLLDGQLRKDGKS